ncbi:PD-(D/E)XK motif protein [Brucella anthropi]|uniref:PD-(D/E)XK motif protein n=1 Tax=Brucella anthropi TaxID=529 RepID=UPI00124CDC51|nr:PD-(D/E)XK motif protein [Brucella anthropi]KAB2790728.1 PD-(D/E)XK motif protein [Brucella anthropi]QOD63062.1 PD-(D/E)XK motif protein [Ochrobactrum sp. MT180101]
MTPDRLLEIWRELGEQTPSPSGMHRRRLDTESPVDIFACVFWPSRRPGILVEGAGEFRPAGDRIPACRGVRTVHEVASVPGPRTILRVLLDDDSLLDIFAVLSADLVQVVTAQTTTGSGLTRCLDRLCMWQILFDRIPAEGLSEERQRGLFGELAVMDSLLLEALAPFSAVTSWVGPDPANQDFVHAGTAVEVKTSLAKRHARVVINNEKQLDERPHRALFLAHLRMDESAARGVSLASLVTRVRDRVEVDPAAARELEDRLTLAGYLDLHAPIYTRMKWLVASTRFFRVEGEFPRLTENNLPVGVGDIRYSIIADDLLLYESSAEQVSRLLEDDNV